MEVGHIATKQDIIDLELKILKAIQNLKEPVPNIVECEIKYLRSKGVRELLNVSGNKLRTMRDNGEIPFSFIGATYYYSKNEIIELLEKNTIRVIK
jgi:hypothetical protein